MMERISGYHVLVLQRHQTSAFQKIRESYVIGHIFSISSFYFLGYSKQYVLVKPRSNEGPEISKVYIGSYAWASAT